MTTTTVQISENQEHRKTTTTENQAPPATVPESSDINPTPETGTSGDGLTSTVIVTGAMDQQIHPDSVTEACRTN